jgi:hypothetical protein
VKRLTLILILTASTAYCEIYTWTDIKGTTHYTNSQYDIPERYRSKSKILDLGIVEKKENNPAQQNAPQQQNVSPPQSEQVQPANPVKPPEAQRPYARPNWEHQDRRMRHKRPAAE